MVRKAETQPLLVIFALIMEASFFLTEWFLCRSSPIARARERLYTRPSLMEFVLPSSSPITAVLQYYSALLQGRPGRLRILWGRGGFDSFDAWAAHPDNAGMLTIFRHAVTTASSWVHRRFVYSSMGWPWRLASIADPHSSIADKRRLAHEFFYAPDEQLGATFGLRLRGQLESSAELLQEPCQAFLKAWSWEVSLSIAPVEFRHGRNRRRCHRTTTWPSFVANYVNEEAALELHTRRQMEPKPPAGSIVAAAPVPRRHRRQTAREIHRYELYAQWRAIGRRVVVKDCWPEVNAEWEALTDEARRTYEVQAGLGEYRHGHPAIAPQPLAPPAEAVALPVAAPTRTSMADWMACPQNAIVPGEVGVADVGVFPLHPLKLKDALASTGERPSVKATAAVFQAEHREVGKSKIPPTVPGTYPRPPGGAYARSTMLPGRQVLLRQLEAALIAIVHRPGLKAAEVFKENLLVACEVLSPESGYAIVAHVASANAVAGRVAQRTNYICLQPQLVLHDDFSYTNLEFVYRREKGI
jgi:hypothetical protein